jgi:hypothetical protein
VQPSHPCPLCRHASFQECLSIATQFPDRILGRCAHCLDDCVSAALNIEIPVTTPLPRGTQIASRGPLLPEPPVEPGSPPVPGPLPETSWIVWARRTPAFP